MTDLRNKYGDKYRVDIPGHGFVVVSASDQKTALQKATKELGVRPDVVHRLDAQGKIKILGEENLQEVSAEVIRRYRDAAKFDKKRQEMGRNHLKSQEKDGTADRGGPSYRKVHDRVLSKTNQRIKKRAVGISRANKRLGEDTELEERKLLSKGFKDIAKRSALKKKQHRAGELGNRFISKSVDAEDDGDIEKALKYQDLGKRATRLKYKLRKKETVV